MILDNENDVYFNMACDEAIFHFYPEKKLPTLRIYGWNKPSLTLGYFQNAEEVLNLKDFSLECPFTRRLTGGWAILHFQEITYSLCLSCKDLELSKSVKGSYQTLTSFIINFYKRLGLSARFAGRAFYKDFSGYKNFCFSSFEEFDILIEGKKIGGNAQRRKKNLIFQQGSIPLVIDFKSIKKLIKNIPYNIEKRTQGLFYFLKEEIDLSRLREIFVNSFRETFGIEITPATLDREEKEKLHDLVERKYRNDLWKYKKTSTSLVEKKN